MESLPDEFAPLLAEELRGLLNNLAATIQLVTPVVREKSEGRYDEYLAIMNQSMYRLMRLTSNLDYTALPEGEITLRTETLDLAGLCRELSNQVIPLAREMGVTFLFESEQATLLTTGDAALLRRMALNLVSNALRAAGEGGEAGLRLTGGRERALLTVWDSGAGLPQPVDAGAPEDLLRRPAGLGLGLAVAQRIARLHGGAVVFEQREDRGLRAVASLPICPPREDGVLKTPKMGYDATGGFSPLLVELSGVLPYRVFMPEDVDG